MSSAATRCRRCRRASSERQEVQENLRFNGQVKEPVPLGLREGIKTTDGVDATEGGQQALIGLVLGPCRHGNEEEIPLPPRLLEGLEHPRIDRSINLAAHQTLPHPLPQTEQIETG